MHVAHYASHNLHKQYVCNIFNTQLNIHIFPFFFGYNIMLHAAKYYFKFFLVCLLPNQQSIVSYCSAVLWIFIIIIWASKGELVRETNACQRMHLKYKTVKISTAKHLKYAYFTRIVLHKRSLLPAIGKRFAWKKFPLS